MNICKLNLCVFLSYSRQGAAGMRYFCRPTPKVSIALVPTTKMAIGFWIINVPDSDCALDRMPECIYRKVQVL